jgi:hypothetical protein
MPKTCVAVPVGGKIHLPYLKETLLTLRQGGAFVVIGLDDCESVSGLGNYEAVYTTCTELADRVMLFPPESYYRRGSIWKKIWDCWAASDCPYLRAVGYDDWVPPAGLRQQETVLDRFPDSFASYANLVIQDETRGRTDFHTTALSRRGRVHAIGRNPFSFICWLVRRELVLTADFRERTLNGAAAWEWLFHATALPTACHCPTNAADSPVRRDHNLTLSSQNAAETPEMWAHITRDLYHHAGYSRAEAIEDWLAMRMNAYYRQQRMKIAPVYGLAMNTVYRTKRAFKRCLAPQTEAARVADLYSL